MLIGVWLSSNKESVSDSIYLNIESWIYKLIAYNSIFIETILYDNFTFYKFKF